jgi:hypothetical protein
MNKELRDELRRKIQASFERARGEQSPQPRSSEVQEAARQRYLEALYRSATRQLGEPR